MREIGASGCVRIARTGFKTLSDTDIKYLPLINDKAISGCIACFIYLLIYIYLSLK